MAYFRSGQMKDAIRESDRALAVATDAAIRLRAREIKAAAFRTLGDAANLRRSEDEYRAAIAEFPKAPGLHMGLGVTLPKQKRDADGISART